MCSGAHAEMRKSKISLRASQYKYNLRMRYPLWNVLLINIMPCIDVTLYSLIYLMGTYEAVTNIMKRSLTIKDIFG